MDNNNENIDSKNDDQEDVDLSELDLAEDDDADKVKEKAQKAIDLAKKTSEQNKQLFARTKKAEGFILKDGKWVKPEKPPEKKPDESNHDDHKQPEEKGLSTPDTMALINNKVNEDDVQKVIDFAKFEKISVSEALKSDVMKTILKDREDKRATALATNTGRTRPGNASQSGDKLLEKAVSTGELPETDEGIDKLVDARLAGQKKRK